jgi:hypothetical protein
MRCWIREKDYFSAEKSAFRLIAVPLAFSACTTVLLVKAEPRFHLKSTFSHAQGALYSTAYEQLFSPMVKKYLCICLSKNIGEMPVLSERWIFSHFSVASFSKMLPNNGFKKVGIFSCAVDFGAHWALGILYCVCDIRTTIDGQAGTQKQNSFG